MKKIAVFVSGNGTNLQAIIDNVARGRLKCEVTLVVSDNSKAYALRRAEKAGIDTIVVDKSFFKSREDLDRAVIEELELRKIDLVVLAGYMRLLSAHFVRQYKNRIINIHPSLLPAFKGTCGIKDAFDYGVKVTGVTVHFVDEELDHGAIILQKTVPVSKNDTLESLEAKIHKLEHRLYPEAIKLVVLEKIKLKGRKVCLK